MKWNLVSNPSSPVHVFNLLDGNTISEVLRYNPLQQSARISCKDKQRLFFTEQSGFHNNRFVYKNEYGFEIGRLTIESQHSDGGSIELEEKKYHYRISATPTAELVIYEHDRVQPLLTCSFGKGLDWQSVLSGNSKQSIHEYASLLLGLCWYLLNPVELQTSSAARKPVLAVA